MSETARSSGLRSPALRRGPLALVAWSLVAALVFYGLQPFASRLGDRASGVITLSVILAATLYGVRRRSVLVSLYLVRPFVRIAPLRVFRGLALRLDQLRHWRTLHLGIGLLSIVALWWHVAGADGGWLEQLLLFSTLLAALTGVTGVLLQYVMPGAMLHLVEREVRLHDVEEKRRALFVAAEERILGRSDTLVESYLRLLRPTLQGETAKRRLLWATLTGRELESGLRWEAQRTPLARDEADVLDALLDLTTQKLRLDLNLFHLQVTTGWLALHTATVACVAALTVFHVTTVVYFGGV